MDSDLTGVPNSLRCLRFDGHSNVLKWYYIFRKGVLHFGQEDLTEDAEPAAIR